MKANTSSSLLTTEFYINSLPGGIALISGWGCKVKRKKFLVCLESIFSSSPLLPPSGVHHLNAHIPWGGGQLGFASSGLPMLSLSVPKPLKHFRKCQKAFVVIMVSTIGPQILDTLFRG